MCLHAYYAQGRRHGTVSFIVHYPPNGEKNERKNIYEKTFVKSRLLSIIATMLLVLCLTACGSQNGGDTKTPEVATPPDLTGEWVQSNSDSKESYQAATISGDTIEIYWVNTDSESKSLYWAGTFVAPETADEPYTWESANDKEKTGSALLASSADTKTFTYEKGEIIYEASALGTTKTVRLEKAK